MIEEIERAYLLPIPIWSVSDSLTMKLTRRFSSARIYTMGQGYDSSVFYPSREPAVEPPVKVVLMGPYHISVKEIPFGLKVFREVKKRFRLRIETIRISPVDTREVEERFYLADTYFWGLRPEEVAKVLRSSHILFSPSNNGEGFGLPVLEAMACGCATCVSEIESYLSWDSPADHAIFFPVGGFDDAVSGLSKLVENKGIRDVLGRKGIEVSRGFSFDRVVDRIKGFIEDF
jgi:glycosyltransferase involved in cell wall biosynthesis